MTEEQLQSKTNNNLSEEEKIQCAREYRDITFQNLLFSERRNSELADAFTMLEVQISTILLGFTGLFLGFFSEEASKFFYGYMLVLIKLMYVSSIFFLIISLILGLLHLIRKEKFWDEIMEVRVAKSKNWNRCIRRELKFEEAMAYERGTTLGKDGIMRSPKWTWILQTIMLGVAIGLIFTLFIVFLYAK